MITTFGPEWENIITNEARKRNQQTNFVYADIIARMICDWPEERREHAIVMFDIGLWTITRSTNALQYLYAQPGCPEVT